MTLPPYRKEYFLRVPGFALCWLGAWLESRAADSVIISEFMAANVRTLASEQRRFDDWIELRNMGSNAVNLEGWSLTDNRRGPRQWVFPATNLPSNGHLLVWATGKDRRTAGAPLHANFKLSAAGEYLALVRPDGSVASEFAPKYPPQSPDVSYGFVPNKTEPAFFVAPTPDKANESATNLPGPLIRSVSHTPDFLKSNEAVTVTVRVSPFLGPVTNVTLWWRAMFHRETNILMTDGGNGVRTTTIPAGKSAEGQILRRRDGAACQGCPLRRARRQSIPRSCRRAAKRPRSLRGRQLSRTLRKK